MRFPACLLLAAVSVQAFNSNAALDRPLTLNNRELQVLESSRHLIIAGNGRLSFAFPEACSEFKVAPPGCAWDGGWTYRGDDGDFGITPIVGEEWRYEAGGTWATDLGTLVHGSKGPVSFGVDARSFFEKGDARDSYDGDIVDVQDEENTGSLSYLSYARYRGFLAVDTRVGRFSVGRDALHWGPGQFTNLVFNQEAIPFHQVGFTTHIGPLSVTSTYADLLVGRGQAEEKDKSVYAHRYELRITPSFLLGISEQLILIGVNKPFLFAPVFPLFIAKSFMHENSNNGNLAFDLSYVWKHRGMVYGEFLLDDLESPSSLLLRNYSQNKWGFMAGVHLIGEYREMPIGILSEYSRIEPWVYGHFGDFPAQAGNLDRPLGNPYGPNSQALIVKAYARSAQGLYLALRTDWLWKGADQGSDMFDPYFGPNHLQQKHFLKGADGEFFVRPGAGYSSGRLSSESSLVAGADLGLTLRVALSY